MREPFLINPVRKRGHKRTQKRHSIGSSLLRKLSATRKRRVTRRKTARRVMRRNPLLDELMIINRPKTFKRRVTKMAKRGRKRSHKKASVGRKHRLSVHSVKGGYRTRRSRLAPHSSKYLLNPIIPSVKGLMGMLPEIVGLTAGYVAVKVIPQYVFPVSWQTGYMKYVSKGITIIGVGAVAGIVLKKPAIQKALVIGGLLSIAVDLIGQVLPMSDMGVYSLAPSSVTPRMMSGMGSMIVPDMSTNLGEEADSRY